MSYKVGMYDRDIGYVRGVMEYINKRTDSTIKIAAFSSENAIEEYIKVNHLDLILLSENTILRQDVVPVVYISDNRHNGNVIFKYQSGDVLVRQLLSVLKNNEIIKQNMFFFYSVYSPLGRCGKTNLALGICSYFKKSLYINLEPYSGIDERKIPYTVEAGDKFIYYLVSRNVQILELLDNMPFVKNAFKVVSGSTAIDVASQITKDDLRWFYKLMHDSGKFNCIVFDIGCSSLSDIGVLEEFQKIFIPVLEDDVSRIKLKRFADIVTSNAEKIEEKLKYISVPKVDFDDEKMSACIEELMV